MTELEQKTTQFISTNILPGTPTERIQQSESLFDDGIIDSLGLQQLVTYLENEYDVFIEEEHLVPENFETIQGMARLISSLKND